MTTKSAREATTKSARETADKGDLTKAAREMTLSSVGQVKVQESSEPYETRPYRTAIGG